MAEVHLHNALHGALDAVDADDRDLMADHFIVAADVHILAAVVENLRARGVAIRHSADDNLERTDG